MRRKNKLVTLFTSLVMATTLLVGCGSSSSSNSSSNATETTAKTESEVSSAEETSAEDTSTEVAVTEEKPLAGVKFVIAINAENAPYESVNASGEYEGYTIDLIAAMADILGFEYEFSDMEFTGLISSVQTGRCDMVFSSISITEEREELVDFTKGYFTPVTTILTSKDSGITTVDDLVGKKVGAAAGTRFLSYVQSLEGVEAISYDSAGMAVPVIGTSELDALVESSSFNYEYLQQFGDKLERYVIPTSLTSEWIPSYGIAFPTGSEYVEIFNECIDQVLSDGTNDEILAKWLGDDYVECLKEAQAN